MNSVTELCKIGAEIYRIKFAHGVLADVEFIEGMGKIDDRLSIQIKPGEFFRGGGKHELHEAAV